MAKADNKTTASIRAVDRDIGKTLPMSTIPLNSKNLRSIVRFTLVKSYLNNDGKNKEIRLIAITEKM